VLPYYDLAFGDRDPVAQPGTSWGTLGTWWTVLALVPDILEHTAHGFPLLYRPTRKLDPKLRELAVLRTDDRRRGPRWQPALGGTTRRMMS